MSSPPSGRRRGLAGLLSLIAVSVLCLAGASSASAAANLPVPPPGGSSSGNSSQCGHYANSGLPRSGDLADPQLNSAGYFNSGSYSVGNPPDDIICVRTVRMWVHYTTSATKTWQVYINGKFAAQKTFTLAAGYYYWTFAIDKDYNEAQQALRAGQRDPWTLLASTSTYLAGPPTGGQRSTDHRRSYWQRQCGRSRSGRRPPDG